MRIMITGVSGQLGYAAMIEAARRGHAVCGISRTLSYEQSLASDCAVPDRLPLFRKVDLTDEHAVKKETEYLDPDAIVHCAAWTAVNAAETPENHTAVYRTNVLATRYLAESADALGAKMLYLSTDYVFSGEGEQAWLPDEKVFAPLNFYGKSKLGGETEIAHALDRFFIVRTAWLFGKNGKNFVRTMLDLGHRQNTVKVVNDQIGTPTYTQDLARLLIDMIETEQYGYYHATNEGGYISWYDFACEIFRQAALSTTVIPVSTEEYGLSKAARPLNSRLDRSKLLSEGFTPLPDWKDALSRYLFEIGAVKQWDR